MQKQTAPQPTIPQHVVERMEDEWRQMRPVRETPPAKPAPQQPAE
ncbi:MULTISPECIES: hypothetical protein [Rhizobium/Agrobacterium group]|jgi:hypothetical protein|nr:MULTISPECIES: hypothetical protein [Rhizobium/Agrobacterium group]TCR93180.1 hypothetical protein EV561_101626 [Rhizobium sp. BK376]